jgi:hypothetical protein
MEDKNLKIIAYLVFGACLVGLIAIFPPLFLVVIGWVAWVVIND